MTFSENVSAVLRLFATAKSGRPFHVYREVHAQQVELLFRQLPLMLVTTVLVGMVAAAALVPVTDGFLLGAWFALLCAVTLYRFRIWHRFAAEPPAAEKIRPHLRAFILSTFLSGSVWGVAGAFLLGEGLAYQYFFGMIIAGLAAGGVSALSSHRAAYAALLVPMVLPYAIRMGLYLDAVHAAIAVLGLVYAGAMLAISHRIHATIAESLKLRFDNLGLVDTLLETKDHLEEANMMLQKEIMERRQAQEILMKSEQKLRLHAYQAPLAFIEWDLAFRVLEWNPAAEKIFGYSRQEALGRHAKSLIAAVRTCETISVLWPKLLNEKQGTHVTVENRTKDRGKIVCEWYYTPLVDPQGKVLSVITLAQDVTASRQAQEKLNYLAYHDELTGLPNRTLFNDRLSQAMIEARRQGRNVAVLLLDVDNFKMVNDTMGHDAGDDLLRDIGKRLTVCVRESDTVARFGGDEFAMVLADVGDPRDTIKVAQKILDAFSPPFFVDGREFFVGTSLGITIYPVDADNLEGLTKNADSAMYHAKAQGRNNFQFYSAELTARAHSRFNMETALRRALERQEFQLHYQPKYDMRTNAVTGVEALLRWKNSDLGVIPPSEFISLAEESGLILPIGEWVFRTACEQLVKWQEQGMDGFDLAVNLSSKQVRHNRLKQTVGTVLAETGLDPRRVEFEITESLLMDGGPEIRAILNDLKEMGFSIALDDFGTGYSSLSYLKRFPIDTLKIDRSFVRDIPGDLDAVAIVRAIIAMSHSLRMKVVAEGVETDEQKRFLGEEGCDEVQGYLCGRPVPADDIPRERFPNPPTAPIA